MILIRSYSGLLSRSFLIFNQAVFLLLSRYVAKLRISFLETRVENVSTSQENGEKRNTDYSRDPIENEENSKDSNAEDKSDIGIYSLISFMRFTTYFTKLLVHSFILIPK